MVLDKYNLLTKPENHELLQEFCLNIMNHTNLFMGFETRIRKMAINLDSPEVVANSDIDLFFNQEEFDSHKFYEI